MQRFMTLSLILVAALGLAACGGEDDTGPVSPLDRPTQTSTLPPMPTEAATLPLLPSPTATHWAIATEQPTRTPYPTPDRSDATDEPLDNYYVPGDWLFKPFEDETGTYRTLDEFLGRAVIVHTLSASCDICVEQQRRIMAAIEDRYLIGDLTDTVFLALSVDENDTPALLHSVLQKQLGADWLSAETLMREDVPADYMVGTASQDLVTELERTFGPTASQADGVAVIVIEPDGLAHLMQDGLVSEEALIEAISFYSNPPPGLEPVEDVEPTEGAE
ncbi:MAG: hypothetical protein JXJ20_15185 [Anaerolineae bacterium]|nr:hypothetical protein [Anaerolineae bacterium]